MATRRHTAKQPVAAAAAAATAAETADDSEVESEDEDNDDAGASKAWACLACTFLNSVHLVRCEICKTRR